MAGEDAPKAKQQTPRGHPQVPFQSTRQEQNTYTLPEMPQVPTSHMVVLKSLLESRLASRNSHPLLEKLNSDVPGRFTAGCDGGPTGS